jgi:NADPH-dependent curcumin reductase
MRNRQTWLCSRPNGIRNLALREAERLGSRVPGARSIPVCGSAMRGWIADKSTSWPRIEAGDTMRALAVEKS